MYKYSVSNECHKWMFQRFRSCKSIKLRNYNLFVHKNKYQTIPRHLSILYKVQSNAKFKNWEKYSFTFLTPLCCSMILTRTRGSCMSPVDGVACMPSYTYTCNRTVPSTSPNRARDQLSCHARARNTALAPAKQTRIEGSHVPRRGKDGLVTVHAWVQQTFTGPFCSLIASVLHY